MEKSVLKLHVGEEAYQLLSTESFQNDWDDLYRNCPWTTVFQGRAFVADWYTVYQKKYLPIIVTESQDGRLTGLLTLAKKDKIIRSAGADLAEYCVWLTEDQNKERFIQEALTLVRKKFPKSPIYFKFIPENVPLNWVKESQWSNHCVIKSFKQPLLKLDKSLLTKKRKRKYEINRMKRLGDLTFERVTTYDEFVVVLEEMIVLHDFRKGALYNKALFQQDPNRKQILLAMFKQGLLHVVVMKLNGDIVSAAIAVIENKRIYFKGILCHSPIYSKYSPGIIGIYLTIDMLILEEFEEIDVSPGDEPYKDEISSHYGVAYVLSIGSAYTRKTSIINNRFTKYVKKVTGDLVAKKGISYVQLKKFKMQTKLLLDKLKNIKNQKPTTLINALLTKAVVRKKVTKYISQLETPITNAVPFEQIRKNNLRDLLAFKSRGTLMTQWQFLQRSMRRLEAGETVYTWCKDDQLMGCVFLNENVTTESGSVQLEGFYFHPDSQPHIQAFLLTVVNEVKKERMSNQLFAIATSTDKQLHKHLEKVGFKEAV